MGTWLNHYGVLIVPRQYWDDEVHCAGLGAFFGRRGVVRDGDYCEGTRHDRMEEPSPIHVELLRPSFPRRSQAPAAPQTCECGNLQHFALDAFAN